MDLAIDEPGHQRPSIQIERLGRRAFDRPVVNLPNDTLLNEHMLPGSGLCARAVDDSGVAQTS
jgi:hypothetical protein